MHPVLDRRHQRVYAGMWIAFATAIALYIVGVAILHLPGIVAALVLAPIPGIALIVLAIKIRPAGFQVRGLFVLDNGQIIESGCFEDLLLQNGAFAQLVAGQIARSEPAATAAGEMMLAEAAD